MAWDSKTTRRRQGSSAAGGPRTLPLHVRPQAKSAYVADPFLQDFLGPSFDPAEYWNSALPSLQIPGSGSSTGPSARSSQRTPVPLADLSTEAQTTISQLNAHTTRLTNTLTQLTDDILRGRSRLAYEVELLRGETLSLAETLTEGLHDDIAKFVPGGIHEGGERQPEGLHEAPSTRRASVTAAEAPADGVIPKEVPAGAVPDEPPYITQLRTLCLVRARLDSVIKTFGDAMEFVFPPSELSVSSSFLSVSAPEPGAEMHSTEEKGQQVLQKLRDEILRLLAAAADPIKRIEDAARRIEELKTLSQVWKGTAEEKGRTKFIEGLAKMVEDRHRELLRELDQSKARPDVDAAGPRRANTEAAGVDSRAYSGYGLISQLQKIRSGL